MNIQVEQNPVYRQLNEKLRTLIMQDYKRGDKFLTERDISKAYNVSRATANKVLAGLASEGILEFRRGVGTFVRREMIDYDVRSLVSFTEKARAAGKKPSTDLITFGELTAKEVDNSIREALEQEECAALWEMERIRRADGVPVIFEHRFVVKEYCTKLTKRQAEGSLYQTWTGPHNLNIAGAEEVIRAVTLSKKEADYLEVKRASPAFEVIAVGFLEDDSPLWWERTLYHGEHYEFHSRLGPIQSATPARGKLR